MSGQSPQCDSQLKAKHNRDLLDTFDWAENLMFNNSNHTIKWYLRKARSKWQSNHSRYFDKVRSNRRNPSIFPFLCFCLEKLKSHSGSIETNFVVMAGVYIHVFRYQLSMRAQCWCNSSTIEGARSDENQPLAIPIKRLLLFEHKSYTLLPRKSNYFISKIVIFLYFDIKFIVTSHFHTKISFVSVD